MPAKKKTSKKRAPARRQQKPATGYPLLSREEFDNLEPESKVRFLEVLRDRARAKEPSSFDKALEIAPEFADKIKDTFLKHFFKRAKITLISLAAHVGVLVIGTGAMLWLGLEKVLDGATVVAILGPLYTYVLVNLRYLTGWKIVGDSNGSG